MKDAPVEHTEMAAEAAAIQKPEPEPAPVAEAPKKRGRPAGAKDTAPRKKRAVIVVEPLAPPPSPAPSAQPKVKEPVVAAAQPEVAAPPTPPSPRTLLRDASRHILQLQRLKEDTRKSYLQNAYTNRLHAV